ncbi:614/534 cytochrome P450 [Hygrophoropsis aurantiaca]|uniref:614/534 cytochrome P450 n=1 Tax=Hygrophoropsis aurantiaca TaxID=72124 RepID=A0ACB7ZYV5_9AGAM|nr:614/534 cytochrome P450 [Hygrophoropsis aurantiaca]
MGPTDVVLLLTIPAILWLYQRWIQARAVLVSIDHHVGYRSAFNKTSIKPNVFGLSPEKSVTWKEKYKLFEKSGWDIVSAVSWFPSPAISFFVADPTAIKEVALKRWKFPKHMKEYEVFEIFGSNLVAAEGERWKRHRKISAPAYSKKTNQFVWEETCRILEEMFVHWDRQFTSNDVTELTRMFALKVISTTGFGVGYESDAAQGHTMSFGEAITVVSRDGFLKLVLPNWVMRLTPRFRRVGRAYAELWQYFQDLVADHNDHLTNSSTSPQRNDLFSSLLQANDAAEGSSDYLTEEELFGNMFIGFFAGHETTANTLAFALILLARHPDEQDRLYSHVKSVMKGHSVPTYSDMSLYTYTTAVINETLRMFPPVTGFPKYSAEDTVLFTTSATSIEVRKSVSIPKGSKVVINVPGLHYNTKYWANPCKWDPSRFQRKWNPDAFIPFSVGSRACIGRKFFEAEATAMLTMLVAHYRVELLNHPKQPEVNIQSGLTLVPAPVSLIFRRRSAHSPSNLAPNI